MYGRTNLYAERHDPISGPMSLCLYFRELMVVFSRRLSRLRDLGVFSRTLSQFGVFSSSRIKTRNILDKSCILLKVQLCCKIEPPC